MILEENLLRFINLQPLGARWSTLILLVISLIVNFSVSLRDLAHMVIKRPNLIPHMSYYDMKRNDPNVREKMS